MGFLGAAFLAVLALVFVAGFAALVVFDLVAGFAAAGFYEFVRAGLGDLADALHLFTLAVVVFLVVDLEAAFFAGAFSVLAFVAVGVFGVDSFLTLVFLASFTGPEGPFGRSKSPCSSPCLSAWEMCLSKAASVVLPSLLLDRTYFLMA